jgi:excisionase family DNA binding protein
MAKLTRLVEYELEPEKNPADELRNHLHALVDLFVTTLVPVESGSRRLGLREVLTPEELAERLKISRSTIEEMARSGKLPGSFRVGKHWRFDLDSLRDQLPLDTKDT